MSTATPSAANPSSAATPPSTTSQADTRGRRPVGPAMRRALHVDAAASGGLGVVLAAGSGALDGVLGIPSGWLLGLGLFMLVYAADLVLVASRPGLAGVARFIAPGNAVWVAASVAAVALGAWDLTAAGVALVLAQAALVAGFVVMQVRAARA